MKLIKNFFVFSIIIGSIFFGFLFLSWSNVEEEIIIKDYKEYLYDREVQDLERNNVIKSPINLSRSYYRKHYYVIKITPTTIVFKYERDTIEAKVTYFSYKN